MGVGVSEVRESGVRAWDVLARDVQAAWKLGLGSGGEGVGGGIWRSEHPRISREGYSEGRTA